MSGSEVLQDAKRGAGPDVGATAARSNASFNTPRAVDAGDAELDFGSLAAPIS